MSGGGIGGTLGSLAGAALAPETGGLSLALPAILGAGGGYLGGRLTHDQNPLLDALMGGVGGAFGGSGLGKALGISDLGGVGTDIASGLPGWAGGTADATSLFGNSLSGIADLSAPTAASASQTGSLLPEGYSAQLGGSYNPAAISTAASPTVANLAAPASSGIGSDIASYLGKQNPLNLALAGGSVISGIQSLLPRKQVNVGQNAADVLSTNPGFNAQLPKYVMQNTATPYNGDWYKYGESPEAPLYNAQPQRLAKGGMVKGYAAGGMPSMPPQGMSAQPQASQIPVNPLTLAAAHHVGVAIGKHLKNSMKTPNGQVKGSGGGHDDAVPAKLSQDEYVLSADVPQALGDGSSNEGAKILDKFVSNIRKHKTSKGSEFPPKARNPLSYLPKGKV